MADARDNRQIYERRSVETESLSSEETTGRTPDMRLSGSGRRSDERTDMMHETESRSLPEKKDKQDSIWRINEAGQIPDYEHSNADTRGNLQQQRRLEEMRRRRHETDSRFWHQKRDRTPDWERSESNWRFDGRAPDWGRSESKWRFDDRTPDWGGSESRRRFDDRTPDWGRSESNWRFGDRTPDWGGSESRVRFDERTPDWGGSESRLRFDDRTPDWGGSESRLRFDERTPDWGGSESRLRFDDRTPDWGGSESRLRFDDRTPDWGGSESRLRFDERTQRRNELVHPGETNCRCWPCRNGCWPCRNVRSSRYNHPTHPPQELPDRSDEPVCKYFRRGYCRYGSDCVLEHEMERDGAESMYQDGTRNRRGRESGSGCDERTHRRYDTEPGFRPEKRSKIVPDPQLRDPRRRLEDISQRSHEIEQERMIQENCSVDARENLQEQIERQRREAQENLQYQGGRENRSAADSHPADGIVRGIMQARREGQNNLQEQRERDSIERQRREAQENLQKQRERDSIEKQRREAQENLQKQRERDRIERQRREAQENLQYWRWRANRSAADSQLLERVARGFTDRLRREDQELNPPQQRLQEMPEIRRNRVTRPPKRFGR